MAEHVLKMDKALEDPSCYKKKKKKIYRTSKTFPVRSQRIQNDKWGDILNSDR